MQRIEPQISLAEQAYQAILDEICQGALAPGTHLVQEQLAERLGVSRQPIQQAMALLKGDGLVQELGARGSRRRTAGRRGDAAALRDPWCPRHARRPARRGAGTGSEIAEEVARRGEVIMNARTAAAAAGDVGLMVHHDVAFHEFLYEVSGNPLLASTAEPPIGATSAA